MFCVGASMLTCFYSEGGNRLDFNVGVDMNLNDTWGTEIDMFLEPALNLFLWEAEIDFVFVCEPNHT